MRTMEYTYHKYNIYTSIAHHMLDTRCELLARDSAYNFSIFRLVTLNEVSWSFEINGNFRHNHIAIFNFTAKWFCSSFLVTMISSILKNVYYAIILLCCKGLRKKSIVTRPSLKKNYIYISFYSITWYMRLRKNLIGTRP